MGSANGYAENAGGCVTLKHCDAQAGKAKANVQSQPFGIGKGRYQKTKRVLPIMLWSHFCVQIAKGLWLHHVKEGVWQWTGDEHNPQARWGLK